MGVIKKAHFLFEFILQRTMAAWRTVAVALYNTYHEIWKAVHHLKATVDLREYEGFSGHRGPVA